MQVQNLGYIRITPDPERPGPSRLGVDVLTPFESRVRVSQIVVTTRASDGPTRRRPVRRIGDGRYEADVELEGDANEIVVVARTEEGVRLRGAFELDVP